MALLKDQMATEGKNAPTSKASPEKSGAPASQSPEAGEEATPQEQAAYEKVVLAGIKILSSEQTHNNIMQMLAQGKNDPAQALADAVSLIMVQLDKKSGGKIPEQVILPAAADILAETAEFAKAANVFQVDDRILGVAMQKLIVNLAEEYGVSPEEVQEFMQSIPEDQAKQASQQQGSYHQQAAQPAATPAAQPVAGG